TRKELLNEDRTFQDVLKVAIAHEVACKETLAFQNNTKPVNESVHTVGRNQIPDKFSNSRNTSNSNNLRPPLPILPRNFHMPVIPVEVLNILGPSVDLEMLYAADVSGLVTLLVFARESVPCALSLAPKPSSAVSASPIVTVGKKDGDEVRVCGDFSVTYNACAEVETYPMPKIEDMHSALRGCQVFSVLDLKQAYHQIPISTESQKYLTINTHLGLFAFKRLPNGIHSGPAIFQRIMDGLLADIPKAVSRLDDILIAGTDYEDHLNTLSQVLGRLLKFGFKLNKSKCKFLQSSVVYLGHLIDSAGLHPTEDKLAAVPPLNNLLKKNVPWKWTKSEDAAFKAAKNLLLNSRTLVHYNESLPLVLSCDASSYGAGAVLSHVINGKHQPIAFASCTLTEAQRNYSQLEKEAFSIIFGLKRFHQYLCANSFTILTDHRPLLTLLGPHCSVPAHTASRLQRWALILALYHYKIEYRSTTAHADADSMSRLPLPQTWCPKSENVECYFFEAGVVTNVTAEMIKKKAQVDPVLSLVYRYIQSGWPSVVDADMIPYKNRSDQLTIHQGRILWGARVVVPPSLRSEMLTELHDTHPGMTRMKGLARSYVWWPKIDSDIEQTVSTCPVCQKMRSEPAKAPVHPWIFPSQPWSRIHIDFAGRIAGKMYLVVIDAYSKFPEVVKMTTTTATTAINALRDIFSRHGLPAKLHDQLVEMGCVEIRCDD
ncbi:Transposon Tf2-9 poly, partial [Paramuricea clavata]